MKKLTIVLCSIFFAANLIAQEQFVFIGTYTNNLYVGKFNTQTGNLTLVDSCMVENPSYIAVSPNKKYVYAITEKAGIDAGSVSAFNFNNLTGKLSFINKISSGGDHPCFVDVHPSGKLLAVANYSGGSFSYIKINDDGSLTDLRTVQHSGGSGIVKSRQDKPHVHQTIFNETGTELYINDLGTDETSIYKVYEDKFDHFLGLNQEQVTVVKANAGAGPRHLAFHKKKSIFYLIEEMGGSVSVYENNNIIQTIKSDLTSKLPGSADIHLSPDGKFLYASNRAESNTISVFKINKKGLLKFIESVHCGGTGPRNFNISKEGKFLIVANQRTNNLSVFTRNKKNGQLTLSQNSLTIKTPVCVVWW